MKNTIVSTTKRQLWIWTCFLLPLLSFAQTEEPPLLTSVVAEYMIIPSYADEQSALSFNKTQSSFYDELTSLFERNASGTKGKSLLLTATIHLPSYWQGKEKFIYIAPQKIAFQLLLNGATLEHITKYKALHLQVTSLLKEGENKLEIVIDPGQDYQEGWLKEISLLATAAHHIELYDFSQAYSHLPTKVTNWKAGFSIRNYSKTPYYGTNGYLFKLYDDSLNLKESHTYFPDTADKQPPAPVLFNEQIWEGVIFHGMHYFKKWTAETPSLYKFTLEGRDLEGKLLEVVSGKAGFRVIRTDGEKLYLGNIPLSTVLTFKAVLYQPPSDVDSSYSREIMREQILKLKNHHVNTIVLRQFAGSSLLYELCDELGMYIIQRFDFPMPEAVLLEEKKRLREANWERILTLAKLLRNHPSVIAYQIEKEYKQMEDLVNVSLVYYLEFYFV